MSPSTTRESVDLDIGTDGESIDVREFLADAVGRHPLAGRIVAVETALLSLAVLVAILGTQTQTHGVGLLNLLSGLLIVTAMLVAVVSVVAAVVVSVHRLFVDLRRTHSPV